MKSTKNKNDITTFTVIKMLMKIIKVKTNVVTNNFIDTESGEIIDTEQEVKNHKIVVDSKRDFIMLSFAVLGILDGLDKTTIQILVWCSLNAEYNSNIVNLTKPMCMRITKDQGFAYQTIKNSIGKLSKKKILIMLGSGTYRVNPRYFWKGQTSEKLKAMKYILDVECPKC